MPNSQARARTGPAAAPGSTSAAAAISEIAASEVAASTCPSPSMIRTWIVSRYIRDAASSAITSGGSSQTRLRALESAFAAGAP